MNTPDSLRNIFQQEASELLADIEETLLNIEKDPGNKEYLNGIFRSMHTLKGSGAVSGFNEISDFTHHIETVFDFVRKGLIPVSGNLTDLVFASLDQIKIMLEENEAEISENKAIVAKIIKAFETFLPDEDENLCPAVETQDFNTCAGTNKTYTIEFIPGPGIFASGVDPLLLLDELRELGLCMVEANTDEIPIAHIMDPEQCYLSWTFTLTTDCGINHIKDVFLFVEDSSIITINEVKETKTELSDISETALLYLCEKLLETGYITAHEFNETMSGKKKIDEILVDAGMVSHEELKSGLETSKIIQRSEKSLKDSTIRVALEKLDNLVNVVAELTITQAQIAQIASEIKDVRLRKPLKAAERLTTELRNSILSVRMIPIGTTFSRFRRYVRDMTRELDKEIELLTQGGDAEMDKTVIEHLNDPLLHLIRNSIDHGIEPPDVREKNGKARKGEICLSAVQKGSSVCITIEDDGAGLDPEKILLKAKKLGFKSKKEPGKQEIFNLLFMPGLSTSEQITNLSGRGVGMDVVKRSIESLQGSIQIDSKKGQGTSIRISLPLTLAIIEGLMIETQENFFILPMAVVDKCSEISNKEVQKSGNRDIISIKDELIPLVHLREVFEIDGKRPDIEQVVIVEVENFRIGIVTDRVVGDHQTVVKSLGKTLKKAQGLSGATIMGNGNVALILDIPDLIRCVQTD